MFSNVSGKRLILASSSPRRKELFCSVGLGFEIFPANIDESTIVGEAPEECVHRLSRAKAELVAQRFSQAWVVGADTIVVVDNQILGKPLDRQDAIRMVSMIQGKSHTVFGGFSVVNLDSGLIHTETHQTSVVIRELSDSEIEAYVDSHESMDKAGAYAVQGVGACLIKEIQGSYTNVVGLPFCECLLALSKFGVIRVKA